ncbi:phage protein, partial [Lacticaseibacillus rhamnosus]
DNLPVIPKAVGEILRSAHGQDNLLGVLETAKYGYKVSETLAWIIANQNTFARAWLLGVWIVDETGEIVKLEAEK